MVVQKYGQINMYEETLEVDWISNHKLGKSKILFGYYCPECGKFFEVPIGTCIDRYMFCPFCGRKRVRIKEEF